MRLINTQTFQLEDFSGRQQPPYAILSHTWGEGEVTFQDLQHRHTATSKPGYAKIVGSCKLARLDGLQYVWVDTCCIDKSSSAELSEAINSMFRWYKDSARCYAYLSDVDPISTRQLEVDASTLQSSRWFRRGWTLQELLAPRHLDLYSSDWSKIGTRTALAPTISVATNIDMRYLIDQRTRNRDIDGLLRRASVAERMSWASRRVTTRTEDMAYCLLGLFGIHMPLLYGEGRNAFRRLQEEIIKVSDDQTLFAWTYRPLGDPSELPSGLGCLATSPEAFTHSGHLIPCHWAQTSDNGRSAYSITNTGLQITLPMLGDYALLSCRPRDDPMTLVVRRLVRPSGKLALYHDDAEVEGPTWVTRSTGSTGVYTFSADTKVARAHIRAHRWWRQTPICIAVRADETPRIDTVHAPCSWLFRRRPDGFQIQRLPPSVPTENYPNRQFQGDPLIIRPGQSIVSEHMISREFGPTTQSPIRLDVSIKRDSDDGRLHTDYNIWSRDPLTGLQFGGGSVELTDGSRLHAMIFHQDIFGETVITVDLLLSHSRLGMFLAEIWGLVQITTHQLLLSSVARLLAPLYSEFFSLSRVGVRYVAELGFAWWLWSLLPTAVESPGGLMFRQDSPFRNSMDVLQAILFGSLIYLRFSLDIFSFARILVLAYVCHLRYDSVRGKETGLPSMYITLPGDAGGAKLSRPSR